MNARQQCFVQEYLVDLCATKAAIRAGYSEKTAANIGHENLRKPEIEAAIQEAMAARAERTQGSQDWIIEKLIENVNRAMTAIPVLDKDGNETGDFTYQGSVANRALELLGKHAGMFEDKVKVDQTVREASTEAKDHNLAVLSKLPAGEVG